MVLEKVPADGLCHCEVPNEDFKTTEKTDFSQSVCQVGRETSKYILKYAFAFYCLTKACEIIWSKACNEFSLM